MVPQDLLEGGMEEMRAGMVQGDRLAPVRFDSGMHHVVDPQPSTLDQSPMHDEVVDRPCGVAYLQNDVRVDQQPGVPDLTSPLGVKWRLVDDDLDFGALLGLVDEAIVLQDRQDPSLRLQSGIPEEVGAAETRGQRWIDRLYGLLTAAFPGGPGQLSLAIHGVFKAFEVEC